MTPEQAYKFTEEAVTETLADQDPQNLSQEDVKRLFAECVAAYLAKVVVAEMGIE